MSNLNRRRFLKGAGAAAIALPHVITSGALGADGRPPASDRITMGGVGMGGQGSGDLNGFMGDKRIQVLAVCDVKHDALKGCQNRVNGRYKNKDCKTYLDYRELIARDDIDTVLCGTPDHWHAQVTIDSMKAGKDIYCEKPLSLTIDEGRKMVETARRFGRVFSCGSQRVIGDYGGLAKAANSGRYGKILTAHASPGGPPRHCYLGGGPVPANTIEWDLWLGPAPWAPYNSYRCGRAYGLGGRGFRTWYDYSGGMMTDWGGHKFGGAMHGLQLDHTGPTDILFPDGKEVKELTYVFKTGQKLVVGGGQKYVCEGGEAKQIRGEKVPPGLRWYEDGANSPIRDLANCVITRKRPFRDVEFAHRAATICHLGNICLMLKRNLKWDPDTEQFIGDNEAANLISRPRRGPWQI